MFTFLKNNNHYLEKVRWWLFVAAGSVLIFVVVLMGGLRLSLPYLTDFGDDIESLLSEELGHPVIVGKMDADWYWFSPRLKLHNVSVLDKKNRAQLIRFDDVYFQFDIFNALLKMKFDPDVITFSGGYVSIKRNRNKELFVQGLKLSDLNESIDGPSSGGMEKIPAFLEKKEIHLLNMKVQWTDSLYFSKSYLFTNVNSIVKANVDGFQLLVDMEGGGEVVNKVLFKAEIKNQINNKSQIKLYVNAHDVMSGYLMRYFPLPEVSLKTKFDTETWLTFSGSELLKATGVLYADNLSVRGKGKAKGKNWQANNVTTRYSLSRLNDEWFLMLDDLNMVQGEQNWEDVYLSLQYNQSNDGLKMRFDYLSLSDLGELVATLPLNDSIKKTIASINARGVLSKTDIYIDDWSKPENWELKTHFSDLGATFSDSGIQVRGVSGKLLLDKNKGKLLLDSHGAVFESKFFNLPIHLERLRSVFSIHRDNNGINVGSDKVYAKVDGVEISTRIKLDITNKVFLDFQLQAYGANAKWLNRHRTDFLFGKSTAQWLSDSVVAGDFEKSELMFHGVVNDFPFSKNDGVLQSIVTVKGGVLKYLPEWPEINNVDARLTVDNNLIVIDRSSGSLYNSEITNTVTTIKINDDPHVIVDGIVQGQIKDVDRFFTATPLKQSYLELTSPITLGGTSSTELRIDIPLSGKSQVKASGRVKLNNAQLKVNDFGYRVTDVNGIVDFDNEKISSETLAGVFKGNAVQANINTVQAAAGMQTKVLAAFKADINDLLPHGIDLNRLHKNSADWKLAIKINHAESFTDPFFSLNLISDLMPVQLNLPYPLAKSPGISSVLDLNVDIFDHRSNVLLSFDDKVNLSMVWDEKLASVRSDMRILDGKAELPESGNRLSARVKTLDASEWYRALSPVLKQFKSDSEDSGINRIQLVADQLRYNQYSLASVNIEGEQLEKDWQFDVSSEEFSASMLVPKNLKHDRPVKIQFDKMDLTSFAPPDTDKNQIGKKDSKNAKHVSPVLIPPLKISGKNFKFKKFSFDSLNLETSNSRYGMTVHALDLKGESLSVKIKGSWFVSGQNENQSSFRIELNSTDVGRMLSYYDFTKSMKKGEGNAVIDWQWGASPFDFDWKLVTGRMQLDVEDGSFIDIEPGAGRLLGMFSLSALPKRFMLDFSDTFNEGFEFTKLASQADFSKGDLYTKNTHIKGSSADVYFNGRVGLANKDFNQTMSVVPRISSGVSGWIAVLQGAAVGLTAYIGQKILGVDEAAKNQYQITGSWKDPVIKKLGDSENGKNIQSEEL